MFAIVEIDAGPDPKRTWRRSGDEAPVVGALLLLLSLLADLIGLGPSPGFGLWQVGGSLAGLALAGVGFWLMRKP